MCKSVVQCDPVKGLQFFILTLARSILVRMKEREEGKKEESDHKLDEELQFNLQLLTEDAQKSSFIHSWQDTD